MTDDELFALLGAMITPLGDAHTAIKAGDRLHFGTRPGTTYPTPDLEAKLKPYIVRRDLAGKPLQEFGDGRIGYADLPGGIGYLRLIAFIGYTDGDYAANHAELTRALDTIFTPSRTKAWRGLIIDLRINGGGADQFGLDLAGRLTRHPYFAYAKQNRNHPTDPTRFTTPQRSQVRPGANPYTGPVVLLTGGSTISAGETFTQATLGRTPQPMRIGESTQGVFSDTMERTLPNGWNFILPNERFLTRSGQTFDGTGIPAHITTPVFTEEEFTNNRDSAFDRAVALLR
ncbi:Peptidase family S41 [Actinokineospora alba]|uniref:Peptidase family S41 n=1 Tax=Actinokineospora alba TaxID=504798 RepID=A0A1H0HMM0_9PSEU|nr:S41 family peptidase [Actinokineospora alba]SDH46979.1 Peptidase family S41 [Actinokineospora alba]SDO20347.1 Peptidase family S41 [Actinokineospora alba]